MVTYFDRVMISTAMPEIQKEFGFSTVTVGWIIRRLPDQLCAVPDSRRLDGRPYRPAQDADPHRSCGGRPLPLSPPWPGRSTSMIVFRFLFGMGEAGAFPNATRSLSRWMLPAERGWAQSVTHAGARLGAAITPIDGGLSDLPFRLALAAFRLRAARRGVGGRLVLGIIATIPVEHKSTNKAEQELIHNCAGRGDQAPGDPVGRYPVQPANVGAGGDLFLLRLCASTCSWPGFRNIWRPRAA